MASDLDIKADYILAQVINGINHMAANDTEGFFAALNLLTGQNVPPPDVLAEDIFSAYAGSSGMKAKELLMGFQFFYDGRKEEGIRMIIDAMELNLDSLENVLEILNSSPNSKGNVRAALHYSKSLDKGNQARTLSCGNVQQFLGREIIAPLPTRLRIRMKKPPEREAMPGRVEQPDFPEQHRLKLLFAASIDDLAYKYESSFFMSGSQRFHDFFIGLASYVSPRERQDVELDHKKSFETLLEAYEFPEEEARMMRDFYDSFATFSAYRMPFLAAVPERVTAEMLNPLGAESVFTGKRQLDNLALYEFFLHHRELIELVRQAGEEGSEKSNRRGMELMKMFEPDIRTPYIMGVDLINARNHVAQMSQLAFNTCQGAEGKLDYWTALQAITKYSGKGTPFDKKRMMKCLEE